MAGETSAIHRLSSPMHTSLVAKPAQIHPATAAHGDKRDNGGKISPPRWILPHTFWTLGIRLNRPPRRS